MPKKNKIAPRLIKEVLAGIDAANDILRPYGAQVFYPSEIEYYDDFGDHIIRNTVDVLAWLEDKTIVITSTKKEVKGGG